MKTETRLEQLAKKPANELNAKELNLVRRYQSYVRKLNLSKAKETKITSSINTLKEQHEKLAAKQSKLVQKIGEIEEEANEKLTKKEEPKNDDKPKIDGAAGKPKLKAVPAAKESKVAVGGA